MITIIMSAVIVALAATTVYYRYTSRLFWSMYQHQRDRADKINMDRLFPISSPEINRNDPRREFKNILDEIYEKTAKVNGAVPLGRIGDQLKERGIDYQGKLTRLMESHGYDVAHFGGIPCVVRRKTT